MNTIPQSDGAAEPSADRTADGDVDLVSAVARGDRDALGALYDRHAPLLLALGVRIFSDRREAEDVLHDVFVEVWKRAGDYDPGRGSVKTWLALRMRSRCLDRVRSAAYSRARALSDSGHGDGDRASHAARADVEGAPDRSRVRAALAGLSDEQREVLELGYFEGLSSAEIAARVGVPVGTVKSRVRIGIGHLRRALGVVP